MSETRSILQGHYKDTSRLDARRQLHAKYSTNPHGFLAWVFEHLCLPPTCQVLEVGCGSGSLWGERYTIVQQESGELGVRRE